MYLHIDNVHHGHNVWFCPQLFERPERKKDSTEECQCLWADLDDCNPDNLTGYDPNIVMESSPNRWQGIWQLDTIIPSRLAEDYSHRIAVKFKEFGVDQSGWDLTQLLRVPYTYNYKYRSNGAGSMPPLVDLFFTDQPKQPVDKFEDLPPIEGMSATLTPLPKNLPDHDTIYAKFSARFSDNVTKLINLPRENTEDWSTLLYRLYMELFDAGCSEEECFVIARESQLNKFERDKKPQQLLWFDVQRAYVKWRYGREVVPTRGPLRIPPLTDENEGGTKVSFVEDYVRWAESKTDAARQYHEATGFVILSALLAGNLNIELEFGNIRPNLWMLLIADTTLTRKSTAMEMGIHLLQSIFDTDREFDPVLATDGSIEGLFSAMQPRSGRASLFWKDEFTGLMESVVKKDYMAGMLEFLTKMYDGSTMKRVLKKETVTVNEPILIILAGGIKNKLFSILRDEHVSSGFLPRFLIISADSDPTKRRPIQRKSDAGTEEREQLIQQLAKLKEVYCTPIVVKLPGSDNVAQQQPKTRVDFTDEALERLDVIEAQLVNTAMTSEFPDHYVPVFDRMAKSCMKMAALIAASRQEPVDGVIWINEGDVISAAKYIERWAVYSVETLMNLGRSLNERILERTLTFIERYPHGVARSAVMNSMKLSAEEMHRLVLNLEQRGMITTVKKGKALFLYPVKI